MECTSDCRRITIVMIRHGYADHNKGKDLYGSVAYYSNKYRFSKLLEKGVDQANVLKHVIEDSQLVIDRIYVSPLDRALETARILFESEEYEMYVTDDIRELNYSHPCNERDTVTNIRQAYPLYDTSLMTSDSDIHFVDGDTHNKFMSIIGEIKTFTNKFYDDMNDSSNSNRTNPTIVLVSHESFLLEFAKEYLGTNIMAIGNCEMVIQTFDINQIPT